MQSVRQSYISQGVHPEAASIMLMAKRPATQKQYDSYLKLWLNFCSDQAKDPFDPNIPFAISFLDHLRKKHQLGYSALNTARSAMSSLIMPLDNVPFGQQRLVKLYMRGVFNVRPPAPRYKDTWDPQLILTLLKSWSPAHQISLKLLTFKVVVLVLLVTGQRIQTLAVLSLDFMTVDLNAKNITFKIFDLIKQSRPGFRNPIVLLKNFPSDISLCVVTFLLEYIKRTSRVRSSPYLFVSFQKPHLVVSKNTLARWVKTVMQMANIDTCIFKPHSIRSASPSAALRGGGHRWRTSWLRLDGPVTVSLVNIIIDLFVQMFLM